MPRKHCGKQFFHVIARAQMGALNQQDDCCSQFSLFVLINRIVYFKISINNQMSKGEGSAGSSTQLGPCLGVSEQRDNSFHIHLIFSHAAKKASKKKQSQACFLCYSSPLTLHRTDATHSFHKATKQKPSGEGIRSLLNWLRSCS